MDKSEFSIQQMDGRKVIITEAQGVFFEGTLYVSEKPAALGQNALGVSQCEILVDYSTLATLEISGAPIVLDAQWIERLEYMPSNDCFRSALGNYRRKDGLFEFTESRHLRKTKSKGN